MPIKQIQLRGISRVPSDRATADGGVSESLNVHLDRGETAPTLPPKDVSTEKVYPSDLAVGNRYPIVFIHKMRGITNYIGHDGAHVKAYGSSFTGGVDTMGGAVVSDPIKHATSIGNTLILYTDYSPYYFLFKGNTYVSLGSSIPKPQLDVACYPIEVLAAWADIQNEDLRTDITKWAGAALPNNENHEGLLTAMQDIWDSIALRNAENRNAGAFVAPFFLRFALRMYDGSYIHTSSPILCGGGTAANWARIYVANMGSEFKMKAEFSEAFRVWFKGSYNAANWGDIVKSIDVFVSTPIYAPAMYANYSSMVALTYEIILEGMESDTKDKTIKDEVLSKGQFYKVLSIDLNDTRTMNKISGGTYQFQNAENVSGDLLMSEGENMVDPYRDSQQYIPLAGSGNFNNRLMLFGVKEMLSRGDMFLNGQVAQGWQNYAPSSHRFTLRYKIVDSVTGEDHYVMAHYCDDGIEQYPAFYSLESNEVVLKHGNQAGSGELNPTKAFAWLCYPDTRCEEVEVYPYGSSTGKKIPMEKHPLLECAYAFLGFGVSLDNLSGYTSVTRPSSFTESRDIVAGNKLFLSEVENPFIFPVGNIVTFPDNLIGAATTSVPLSEGQFGEFPLYVFTEGGIRVLVTTADGTFAANVTHPNLSRHVALPGTITSIEQAVVFITKKGVMMLHGGTVTELSTEMNGTPFVLNGADGSSLKAIRDNLLTSSWASILAPTIKDDTFMKFMETARIAYDFNGSRLIFIKANEGFQYEYRFDTQTWHKSISSDLPHFDILNSYPECLISWSDQGSAYVLDHSTQLDSKNILSDSASPVYGIIVTRPFTLGEPDIRKAIRSIRIRGRYNRSDVQYLILGSFDDINWKWVKTLRGGSYKMFRIVILTKLTAMERITWIDIDYESRFTNRLR